MVFDDDITDTMVRFVGHGKGKPVHGWMVGAGRIGAFKPDRVSFRLQRIPSPFRKHQADRLMRETANDVGYSARLARVGYIYGFKVHLVGIKMVSNGREGEREEIEPAQSWPSKGYSPTLHEFDRAGSGECHVADSSKKMFVLDTLAFAPKDD